MNYLQLCQEVARDSGTVAGPVQIASVEGATGRVADIAAWVKNAYLDIQNERNDWRWMRKSFSHALTEDENEYDPVTDLEIADFGSFIDDMPAEGFRNLTIYESGEQEQEGEITQIPYNEFRRRYLRGVHDANKPTEWAVSPQGLLLLGNTPDEAYILAGEYRMAAEELAEDDDEPAMPAKYHRVIVAEALRLMMRSDEAYQVLAEKAQLYERVRDALVREQTPDLVIGGGSLA